MGIRTEKNPILHLFQLIGKVPYWLILLILQLLASLTHLLINIYSIVRNKVSLGLARLFNPKSRLVHHSHSKIAFDAITSVPKSRLTRHRLFSPRLAGLIAGIMISIGIILTLYSRFLSDLPSLNQLNEENTPMTTKIYDRNGTLLYKIYRDKNRTVVKLSELPEYLIKATIAIEDKKFFNHRGISLTGIGRALYETIINHETQGGSTITQQLIKNTLLTPEQTMKRKIKELFLAIAVEKRYDKNEILELYLNQVGFGGTAYGIEEASQAYFGIPAQNLSLAQAALLAGLPASPTRFSPFGNNPNLAKERQLLVLQRMKEEGFISEFQRLNASIEPIKYNRKPNGLLAPHFVMYVKELMAEKYGDQLVEQGGLEITTSLDLTIQNQVAEIVRSEVEKLGNLHITNGAALVTNPKTGEILAMVGSKDYFAIDIDGNYNVTTALRQPGSSIKPVNYSIALENGFTPAYLIDDSPITYKTPGSEPYSPTNYDRRFHGQVPLRIALGSSYNVPAVKILAAFGVKKMIERGQQMGINTWQDPSRYGLSLTLGGGEVKMTELATAYGVLANQGIRTNLNPILKVADSRGKILEETPKGELIQAIKPETAYLLTDILSDNSARTPAFGPNSLLNIADRKVAVKTGTTQNLRDNWTIGYTPSRLVAVWVGNNDNTPMSYVASGVTGASPIWRYVMDYLLQDVSVETFPRPENIEEATICQTSYSLPCEGCPKIVKDLFVKGTVPKSRCNPNQFTNLPTPGVGKTL